MVYVPLPQSDEKWGWLSVLFALAGFLLVVPALAWLVMLLFGVHIGSPSATTAQGVTFMIVWQVGNALWFLPVTLVRLWEDERKQRRADGSR